MKNKSRSNLKNQICEGLKSDKGCKKIDIYLRKYRLGLDKNFCTKISCKIIKLPKLWLLSNVSSVVSKGTWVFDN